MTVATKYTSRQTDDGLLVESVVLAVEGEVRGRGVELTRKMFKDFTEHFNSRKARGYTGAFVLLNHDGPKVGKIVNLSDQEGELLADILIKDESVAARVKSADLTDISITFSPSEGILQDVSLLDNAFGQLADKIPPLVVEAEEEFDIPTDKLVELNYKDLVQDKEQQMALTEEDLQAISELIDSKISAALDSGEDDGESGEELEAQIEAEADRKLSAMKKELEEQKRKLEIDSYVAALSSKTGNTYSDTTLRKIFDGLKSEEARKVKFESMMKSTADSVKADIEDNFSKPTVEKRLKDEYRKNEDNWKKMGISEEKYVRLNAPKATDLK